MKVAVLGGTGVFGSRLAEMLVEDGHAVTLVARRQAPLAAMAAQIGAHALVLDRSGPLQDLWDLAPDVVVDAAGPFQAYGADPYSFARLVVSRGIGYLDLADCADFCAGIADLNDLARQNDTFAISGLSSVPGLSSAVVGELVAGARAVQALDIAILPGNRAPRGRAVVQSILAQVGRPLRTVEDGRTVTRRSWSDPVTYALGRGMRRRGYRIEVPDLRLFPAAFGARTVAFRAGLELGLMARGLAVLGWLRARLGLRPPAAALFLAAQALERLGTDAGGMRIEALCRRDNRWNREVWRLRVFRGQGPYIPGVAVRALLRRRSQIAPGARPAVGEVTLAEAEDAMASLQVETDRSRTAVTPLFQQVLAGGFDQLPEAVRRSHDTVDVLRLAGRAQVTRGAGPLVSVIAAVFRFPPAAQDIEVEVVKTPTPQGETWVRRFGTRRFRSHLAKGPRGMTERFGPFTFDLALDPGADGLAFPVSGGRIGPVPLPRWALPRSEARETVDAQGRFCFDVALFAPFSDQLIVRYRGWLTRAMADPSTANPSKADPSKAGPNKEDPCAP